MTITNNNFSVGNQLQQIAANSNRGSSGLIVSHLNRINAGNISNLTEEAKQNLHYLRHKIRGTQPQDMFEIAIEVIEYVQGGLRGLGALLIHSRNDISDGDRAIVYKMAQQSLESIKRFPERISGNAFLRGISGIVRDAIAELLPPDRTLDFFNMGQERPLSPNEYLQNAISRGETMSSEQYDRLLSIISSAISTLNGAIVELEQERDRVNVHIGELAEHNESPLTSQLIAEVLQTEFLTDVIENILQNPTQAMRTSINVDPNRVHHLIEPESTHYATSSSYNIGIEDFLGSKEVVRTGASHVLMPEV